MNGDHDALARHDERIATLEREMAETRAAIQEIRGKLLNRLPNWAALLITVLSMTVAGLIGRFFA